MSKTSLSFFFLFTFALFALTALMCASAAGQNNYKVIHSFSGFPNDGMLPTSSTVFDKLGNMYGTTSGGGNQAGCGDLGCGIVYELSPDGQGNWTETVLYNFCSNFNGSSCLDGAYPNGLTIDAAGNLYGTTFSGGSGYAYMTGPGVAFELSPPKEKGGTWAETVLYNFCTNFSNGSCQDGWVGEAGPLVFDNAGNLYGTAGLGGTGHVAGGEGVAFKLSPGALGWQETILYSFCTQGDGDECPDGYNPGGGVTFDKSGNLYGTTPYSGNISKLEGGTLFVLSRNREEWKYQLLAAIPPGMEPYLPFSPIAYDAGGNLYSTLSSGGNGGVFRIDARSRKLSLFRFNGSDGAGPGTLYIDPHRNALYGTTGAGGAYGRGTIYTIDTTGRENVLYSSCSQQACRDGYGPGGIVPDAMDNLYGTAEFGGDDGLGVVFEFIP